MNLCDTALNLTNTGFNARNIASILFNLDQDSADLSLGRVDPHLIITGSACGERQEDCQYD
ncbi:MAG: hypothetical protein IH811_06795 [Proteobacteria bacterium]|nr:hypothetical protein [Pseudomonadota bacterium]